MDGKEIYNHELVNDAIKRFIEEAHDMGMNMLELQKTCEAVAISCQNLIQDGLEVTLKEEAPSED